MNSNILFSSLTSYKLPKSYKHLNLIFGTVCVPYKASSISFLPYNPTHSLTLFYRWNILLKEIELFWEYSIWSGELFCILRKEQRWKKNWVEIGHSQHTDCTKFKLNELKSVSNYLRSYIFFCEVLDFLNILNDILTSIKRHTLLKIYSTLVLFTFNMSPSNSFWQKGNCNT